VSLLFFPNLLVRSGFFSVVEVDGLLVEVDNLPSDLSDLSDDLGVEDDFVDNVVVECHGSREVSVFHSQ
jgi:hypothetical protein